MQRARLQAKCAHRLTMDSSQSVALCDLVAARMIDARMELTARWLERIVDRVTLPSSRVFPTDELLDHMPLLIEGIAAHIREPSLPVSGNGGVADRARELGTLRYAQGFAEHELQKEYELLGGILYSFVQTIVDDGAGGEAQFDTAAALECARRLFHAVEVVQQVTVSRFLEHLTTELSEREERLQSFHRALTHEIRNRVGATLGAGELLQLSDLDSNKRSQLVDVVVRNARGMHEVLDNLLELTRVSSRQQRNVTLRHVTSEAARQLREAAEARGVAIRIAKDLPPVEVNAAAVELCLTNLISNGIKYADMEEKHPYVEIRARPEDADGALGELIIEVVDNGIGIPESKRDRLFDRFYRAHEHTAPEVAGTGLGLSIVRDVVHGLGGRVWAEFPEKGMVFAFSMPCRRLSDAPALAERARLSGEMGATSTPPTTRSEAPR